MTINCHGRLIDLEIPKVLGILNVTPDSFFDGGSYTSETAIVRRAAELLEDGADFIDLGAYSSRPNAEAVSVSEEISRLLPALNAIMREFPDALISIDTFRAGVAKAGVEHGAAMINDISAGLLDPQMLETVAAMRVPYIMMHMKGNPQTMQSLTQYENIIKEMLYYFSERINQARNLGISDIIIDPGFGFSKTMEQNYEVMAGLELFANVGVPMLVGISRKSMIYKLVDGNPETALNGTSILHTVALSKGADMLRVHDVKEAVECIRICRKLDHYNISRSGV